MISTSITPRMGLAADPRPSPAVTPAETQKSPAERACDDLRWIMTALEAYGIDNDSRYAPAAGPRSGVVADLDGQLDWYFKNTYPKRSSPPHKDPWDRPYLFVISGAGTRYALYSLGREGKLDAAAEVFLGALKRDETREQEGQQIATSNNIIMASGSLRFAPLDVQRGLRPAK